MILSTTRASRTRHHADLAWWCDVYNGFAQRLDPTILVRGARRGAATRVDQTARRRPLVLEVASPHLSTHSDTLTGRYLAALAATSATTDASLRPRKGSRLWHILLISALLGLGTLLGVAFTDGSSSTVLVAAVATIVSTAIGFPLASWSVRRQSEAFHKSVLDATRLAGPAAAESYADSGAHLHRTFLHNLLTGHPLTPNAYREAILASIRVEKQD